MKKSWFNNKDLYTTITTMAIGLSAVIMAGCGLAQEKLETVTPEEAFQETHFISAAPMVLKESGISEYQASCSMHIDNVAASLVLGDAKGEAGRLFLCELSDGPDSASFAVMEGLDAVSGSIETRYGTISVSYDKNSGTMKVAVPKDTTCTLTLPTGQQRELESGEHEINY